MNSIPKLHQILIILLFIILLGTTIYFAWNYFNNKSNYNELVIGAGSKNGEAFKFAQAIAKVMSNHFPEIKIKVIETSGSTENMELLASNQIDLATIQADVDAISSIRIISNLYPDMFQLIVRKDSGINSFHDLKGKRMSLPSNGSGQWGSFWFVANHYGIYESDINKISFSSSAAKDAIINGEIDAIFKVRAPRNKTILNILKSCPSKIISINQASALKLRKPSLSVGEIPSGAYNGNPLVPETNLKTIAVNRLLVANKDVDDNAIYKITQILYERRLELLKITPLAGMISRPDIGTGTFLPIHNGALNYFNRDKPSFFVENADFVALIVSLFMTFISVLIGYRKKISDNKKNLSDEYIIKLLEIINFVDSKRNIDIEFIYQQKKILLKLLSEAFNKLDKDNMTLEGFQSFSFVWDKANNLLIEKKSEIN